jgi:DNA-binding winged helix-turn-helix (wHTH) protein
MNKLFAFGLILLFSLQACEKDNSIIDQDREEVIMRKIGHEVLLKSNDSTSIVRPIVYEEGRYRIQFGSDFGFQPETFIGVIDSIIKNSHLNESYLVQIEKCESAEVVYSYEVDVLSSLPFPDEVACQTRPQPEDCYEIVIQFFREKEDNTGVIILLVLLTITLSLGQYYYYKKRKIKINKNTIKIGEYLYDANKMVLIRQEKTIELTSKENELLSLLNENANETISKETILNKVWGDEGDYVGRTLDVYVSKLRKKLENDSSIELKNIRGVGYKLIVED